MGRFVVMLMRKRAEVYYSGRVQGVGFRYTVRQIAQGYEVAGSVKNLDDGRVELIAEGEEEEVRQFVQAIRQSELGDYIRNATESWKPVSKQYKGFTIAH